MLHFGQESSMENMVVRNLDGCLFRMVYKSTFQTFGVTPDHLDKKGLKFASIIRDGFWVKVGAGHLGMINDNLFVREEDLLTSLKQRLNEMVPNNNERDSLKWRWDTNAGMFTVKSCYEKWDKELNAQNYIGPHCHLIWRNICPDSIQSGDLHMASYTGVACNKSVSLELVVGYNSLPIEEAFQLRRSLFDWESEQLQTLKHLLNNCGITTTADRADQIEWRGCTSKMFCVKSMYSLCGHNESITDPIYKFIWKNIAPHNTKCFGWLVVERRVKTGDYWHRLGIIHSVDGALCKFCNEHIETMDHFLLLCTPVWSIWTIDY
ncbi:hypothetical protein RHSIM_Rhsim10G0042600 [Rhododendron simsii]|uniref:Reverse transcriptase zinc-binding domain-containing protein n=1 Tax=Rhododendron simsii TaxID=118357 RepID=A0A834LBR7_RHOSS|nr:hypothetical protein RHSIM_Rhsim10G0042600 [Rhododendron simsii]